MDGLLLDTEAVYERALMQAARDEQEELVRDRVLVGLAARPP